METYTSYHCQKAKSAICDIYDINSKLHSKKRLNCLNKLTFSLKSCGIYASGTGELVFTTLSNQGNLSYKILYKQIHSFHWLEHLVGINEQLGAQK